MRVLIACEESQTVCKEFRRLGHDAYSCDILPCSGGYPEWHIQEDVRNILYYGWDLIIAHPPCTYLCIGSAVRMFPGGVRDEDRYKLAMQGKEFFNLFYNFERCKHIAIENPIPLHCVGLPKPDQIIQPYMFGEPFSKKTCLWLKGLPQLLPNPFFVPNFKPYVSRRGNPGASSARDRSLTFQGIAHAMAIQWSEFMEDLGYE